MSDATGSTSAAEKNTGPSKRSASSADDRQSGPALLAPGATSKPTGRLHPIDRPQHERQALAARGMSLLSSADSGPTAGDGEPQEGTQTSQKRSGNSAKQTSGSAVRWDTPAELMDLVAQSNRLATMLLNGEADIATARAYAEVTKTIASLVRSEIERRRFIGGEPLRLTRS